MLPVIKAMPINICNDSTIKGENMRQSYNAPLPRVEKVIISEETRGGNTRDERYRIVRLIHTLNGVYLGEHDPQPKTFIANLGGEWDAAEKFKKFNEECKRANGDKEELCNDDKTGSIRETKPGDEYLPLKFSRQIAIAFDSPYSRPMTMEEQYNEAEAFRCAYENYKNKSYFLVKINHNIGLVDKWPAKGKFGYLDHLLRALTASLYWHTMHGED